MSATATISGSHWRQSVVQSESLTKVHDICTIFCSFAESPLFCRHFAYLIRLLYGWSTDRSNLMVCKL